MEEHKLLKPIQVLILERRVRELERENEMLRFRANERDTQFYTSVMDEVRNGRRSLPDSDRVLLNRTGKFSLRMDSETGILHAAGVAKDREGNLTMSYFTQDLLVSREHSSVVLQTLHEQLVKDLIVGLEGRNRPTRIEP